MGVQSLSAFRANAESQVKQVELIRDIRTAKAEMAPGEASRRGWRQRRGRP